MLLCAHATAKRGRLPLPFGRCDAVSRTAWQVFDTVRGVFNLSGTGTGGTVYGRTFSNYHSDRLWFSLVVCV